MPDCIFCRIVAGEIPCRKVYEDEDMLAFHDIAPQAPVHFMIVPRKHIASLAEAGPEDAPILGRMLAARQVSSMILWATCVGTSS